jgi:bacteriorhodopsin
MPALACVRAGIHIHMVQPKYRTALCISGLVTGIAFYHYFRMFNSWTEAYTFLGGAQPFNEKSTEYTVTATGNPYNDAYRYMDWLLTVPLLLIELILIMGLDEETTRDKSIKLGTAAALMIALGYPGEIAESNGTRMLFWVLAMIPFLYIVYELFVNLKNAVAEQPACARELVSMARYVTIISWLTYPFVYVLPVLGVSGTTAMVGVQIGYSISDFISKCGLGLMITMIALRKSRAGYSPLEDADDVPLLPVSAEGTDESQEAK